MTATDTDEVEETAHVPALGAVTAHALVPPELIVTPDKVMIIPALAATLVRAWMGVNVNEAVVIAAFTAEVSVIWRPLMPEICTNVPVAVVSRMVGDPADKSNEVHAPTLPCAS